LDFNNFLPYQSPLATAAMSTHDLGTEEHTAPQRDPLEGVPTLSTYIATEPEDVVPALKLVADSVAQQRQIAARILIFHPLNLAVMALVFAGMMQWLYKDSSDLPLIFTTSAGLLMAGFAAVKWMSSGYIELAEDINWNWLVADDQVLVTKFGEEVIGTCILGWEKGEGRGNRRKTWGKGVIKGWAVRIRYRGKGVGSALLEEAVKVVEKKGGDEIIFADDHASKFSHRF
jgi:ribosomal protein S18 acetylase RimI-like enzyme